MKVEKIDHIVVVVKDLATTAKFFSNLFNNQFYGPIEVPGIKISFDSLGLELMQSIEPGNPVAERLEKHGEGTAWIALKVPNLDEAVAELRAKGIAVEYWGDCGEPTHKGDIKAARILSSEKTFGVGIELVEYEDVKSTALAMFDKLGEVPRM